MKKKFGRSGTKLKQIKPVLDQFLVFYVEKKTEIEVNGMGDQIAKQVALKCEVTSSIPQTG